MPLLVLGDHETWERGRIRLVISSVPVRIGQNVWIGGGAIVLPGDSIGDDRHHGRRERGDAGRAVWHHGRGQPSSDLEIVTRRSPTLLLWAIAGAKEGAGRPMETRMKNVICSIAAGILIGAGAFAVSADQAAVTAPEGSAPVLELVADGVQIYTCGAKESRFEWSFKAPEAHSDGYRGPE